jgi:CheY-like chemotaxis protein
MVTSPIGTTDHSNFGSLRVLVAEDDPINSKIVQKRLQRSGHSAHLTINGEECVTAFKANPKGFDAVLMDIQVSSASDELYWISANANISRCLLLME